MAPTEKTDAGITAGPLRETSIDTGLAGSTANSHRTAFRSSDRHEDVSECGDLDPRLADLMEAVTDRLDAGETIDVDQLVREHPDCAEQIRRLVPALQNLAVIGRSMGADVMESSSHERDGEGHRVFGDFRIFGEVGRGGMGIVYEARQITIARRVALKVLPMAAAADPRAIQRFQLEAQVAGLLEHPHIVPVYSVGIVADVPYYAMQYIEGGSLADLIAELRGLVDRGALAADDRSTTGSGLSALAQGLLSGRFAAPRLESDGTDRSDDDHGSISGDSHSSIRSRAYIRTVVRLGIQAADALGYAHDQGIIHRDVKPANLLLDRRCHLWVADFGMADVQGDTGLTMTGDLPGTLRYMSPEQATGKRALVDRRTDLYALGATLYELLTLHTAVRGVDRQEILRRIVEQEPDPIRRFNAAVPVDLATIVTKALSKEPANRYETARQMADDLGRFLEGRPITARPLGPVARTWRWCRRKPLQATLAASLVVGVTGITWNWREAVRQKGLHVVSEQNALTHAAKAEVAEKEARRQAARADAINAFLIEKVLSQAEPYNNPRARSVTLLETLDRAAAEVGQSFADQPENEAAIRIAIARAYRSLGKYAQSEAHFRAAYEILKTTPDGTDEDRLKAMGGLGISLTDLQRPDEAEPLLLRAYDEARRILGPDHKVSWDSTGYLAGFHLARGRLRETEVLVRQQLEQARVIYGPQAEETLSAMNNLGFILQKQQKSAEAEPILRECVRLGRGVYGPEHPRVLIFSDTLAEVQLGLGHLAEAESLLRPCLDGSIRVLGPEHPRTLVIIRHLAVVLAAKGQVDEAMRLFRSCLEAQSRSLGAEHRETRETAELLDALLSKHQKRSSANTGRVKD
jgi:serine/threonine protein kinase/tetratricopeptide (TPR) repeat protein